MVEFLIHRPIAVLVSAFALAFLGAISTQLLPISLMPEVEIPEITVQVSGKNQSARELEDAIIGPLRRELLQVPGLKDIESQTRVGIGILKLEFAYGTSINYAFLDVNEQVDAAMARLPKSTKRPHVIKASATDLPVFYLNLSFNTTSDSLIGRDKFLELSDFAEEVIRKRLEQLPEIALVDITGKQFPEIQIQPDFNRMLSLGIRQDHLKQALDENNVNLGNLLVRDGQYQYNIRFSSFVQSVEDIANIYMKADDRILQIKDIADVSLEAQTRNGAYLSSGKEALGLAIIKQADARMSELQDKVLELTKIFEEDYPDISFSLSQDQSQLLTYSIKNLGQSLLLGSFLAFIILFLFLREARAPWLIGIAIPLSVLLSLLFFYLLKISINIISLSGLVLGVGLMIDNAIIVIDNINQQRVRGLTLSEACIQGTNEVIRPLISSALTTSAVFIPLIFLSGISGALFLDQALAVTIGLGSSLLVSITLLPTLYRLFYRDVGINKSKAQSSYLFTWYKNSMDWVFNHPFVFMVSILILFLSGIGLASTIPIRQLPLLSQRGLLLELNWNEPLHMDTHIERVKGLLHDLKPFYIHDDSQLGTQQFLLNPEPDQSPSELRIYLETQNPTELEILEDSLQNWLAYKYPEVPYNLSAPPNLFERLFSDEEPPLLLKVSQRGNNSLPDLGLMGSLIAEIEQKGKRNLPAIPTLSYQLVEADLEKLALYQIDVQVLYQRLQTAFRSREIGSLLDRRKEIPILISGNSIPIGSILSQTQVSNNQGVLIPVSALVSLSNRQDYQTLSGGKSGTYVPLAIQIEEEELELFEEITRSLDLNKVRLDIQLAGSLYSGKEQLIELAWVMLIALIMLYFILAAQFESLLQPFIVLLEVPIDLAAAIIFLWLGGSSLNLMSMIGMIVMSGIIINDSILKIDTINRLYRNGGMTLKEAIHEGGKRRLIPIIMTSLTTILAVLPFLFSSGLGADLQKPLAWALIGGMFIGTFVSLFFIPLAYFFLYRNKSQKERS